MNIRYLITQFENPTSDIAINIHGRIARVTYLEWLREERVRIITKGPQYKGGTEDAQVVRRRSDGFVALACVPKGSSCPDVVTVDIVLDEEEAE